MSHSSESRREWNGQDYYSNSEPQRSAALNIVNSVVFKGDEQILDLGSGDGYVTSILSIKVPLGFVMGIDPCNSMIEFASKKFNQTLYPNLTFRLIDAVNLDYVEKFDLVTSFSALQFVQDQLPVLHIIHRSLKPQGRFLATMPASIPAPLVQAASELMVLPNWSLFFKDFTTGWFFHKADAYQNWLEQANLIPLLVEYQEVKSTFRTRQAFTGFLTQWFPYLTPIPDQLKRNFLSAVIDRYLELILPADNNDITFSWNRLTVEAKKL